MTKTKLAFAGLLATALLVALVLQQAALEAEHTEQVRLLAMKPDLAESSPTPAPPDAEQILRDRSDLVRLRTDSANLRAQIAAAKASKKPSLLGNSNTTSTQTFADIVIRPAEARDEGQATPVALLQTLMWAVTHGDTNRMYDLMALNPDVDLQKVQQQMKDLRDELDRNVPDGMLKHAPLEVRILSEQVAENGDHWLAMVERRAEDPNSQPERLRIRWSAGGWQFVIGTNGEPVHESVQTQP